MEGAPQEFIPLGAQLEVPGHEAVMRKAYDGGVVGGDITYDVIH